MAAPTILSIPTILDCAKLAGGYAIIDREKQNNLFGGYIDSSLPEKIFFVWKRVQKRYDKDPTDTSLRDTANLLWSLIGRYGLRALTNLEAGGVVITPATNVANYLIKLFSYPQFVVGDTDSPMVDGDTVLEIFDDLIVPQSGQGEVTIHTDGNEQGQMLPLGRTSYTAIYTTGKYTITFSDPVRTGLLVMIDYPIRVNLVFQSGVAPVTDDEYTAVLVDFEIRTLLNTAGNIFTIPAGTQGKLNIKLGGVSTLGEKLYGEYNYYVNNIGGTITLSLSDGGIIYSTFATSMYDNIAISGNNTLQGVQIVGTGQVGSTITLTATFNYSPFGI
jgi:hypothetical protein